MPPQCVAVTLLMQALLILATGGAVVRAETAQEAKARHQRVAERRKGVHVLCHRGAVEFAHENTLEAYRAAFALGADGNEIDIRATKDGVLVCFHDDMLDHLLEAYGDVGDYTWSELRRFPFRRPGPFGDHCRIPSLREVLELHRRQAGLLFLDVKRPGLVEPISKLLDELDMWDHVVQAPGDFRDPRLTRTRFKAGLYLDRGEVDARAIAAALKLPGQCLVVEDPRGVSLAMGRAIAKPSDQPVSSEIALWANRSTPKDAAPSETIEDLLVVLQDADDWSTVAKGAEAEAKSAQRILRRARAADGLARRGVRSPEVFRALQQRVRHRSLHRDWRYCGLDGSAALRAMVGLRAPQTVQIARFCLWRDDPGVAAAQSPQFDNPRSWTDWRTKMPVFPLLESLGGAETQQLCREYLALSDDQARRIGVPQFEAAARTLLTISPTAKTAKELLNHRLSAVRGRAILFCLAHAYQSWARETLQEAAPHALRYVVGERQPPTNQTPGEKKSH